MYKTNPKKYHAAHYWIRKRRVKTGSCEFCGISRYTHWSNKSGEYKEDLSDWHELCVPCHSEFDGMTIQERGRKGGLASGGGPLAKNRELAQMWGRKGGLKSKRKKNIV